MIVIRDLLKWKIYRKLISSKKKIGVVMTMGCLHIAHEYMINKSIQENDITIVTIFINPTQFNCNYDLQGYPIKIKKDLKISKSLGVAYVLLPRYSEMYPERYSYRITEDKFSKKLEGKYRLYFFSGVLTIVMKFLNLIKPNNAYFGEKDFQQFILIKEMVKAFFLEVNIIFCPTIRENTGLAASSRNVLLSKKGLDLAKKLYFILKKYNSSQECYFQLKKLGLHVEYVKDYNKRRYAAIYIEGVRLIDNIKI